MKTMVIVNTMAIVVVRISIGISSTSGIEFLRFSVSLRL